MEIIRGSGNVFRDLGYPNADREQLRALLAANIIGVLDERKLTVREAQEVTGVTAADFCRIRKANLDRFTIDRLMTILAKLGQEVEIKLDVHPRGGARMFGALKGKISSDASFDEPLPDDELSGWNPM